MGVGDIGDAKVVKVAESVSFERGDRQGADFRVRICDEISGEENTYTRLSAVVLPPGNLLNSTLWNTPGK